MPGSDMTVSAVFSKIGTAAQKYAINVGDYSGGRVIAFLSGAAEGETVVINALPKTNYKLESVTVTGSGGQRVSVAKLSETSYSFTMSENDVTVNVVFSQKSVETGTPKFTDVPSGEYYAQAVQWAVENDITTGTSATTFSPDGSCTRGQIVTFLWRYMG